MIRRRFGNGRILRITAWALAGITSMTAWLHNETTAAATDEISQGDGPPATAETGGAPAVPAAPDSGLLILRYQPAPLPPPPTMIRLSTAEEAPLTSATPGTPAAVNAAPSGAAALPLPPPARLPAPLQSSGS